MKVILHRLDLNSEQELRIGEDDFWIQATATVGEDKKVKTSDGFVYPMEIFTFYFTTQKFLDRTHDGGYTLGRGEYIVDKFSGENDLRKFIEKIIDDCSTDVKDWKEFANKLNEHSYWEYDNYQEKL